MTASNAELQAWGDKYYRAYFDANAKLERIVSTLDRLETYADSMDKECTNEPCIHSGGYRESVRQLREALAS